MQYNYARSSASIYFIEVSIIYLYLEDDSLRIILFSYVFAFPIIDTADNKQERCQSERYVWPVIRLPFDVKVQLYIKCFTTFSQ